MVNGTPDWDGYYLSAYGIAVKHGFQGSEEEWLASLGLPARVAAELANAAAQSANTAAGLANEAATAANTAAQGVEDVIDGAIDSFSEQAQAAKTAAEAAADSVEEALGIMENAQEKIGLMETATAATEAATAQAAAAIERLSAATGTARIYADDWYEQANSGPYRWECECELSNVAGSDRVTLYTSASKSQTELLKACALSPVVQAGSGYIYIQAKRKPEGTLVMQYKIEKGA